MQGGHFADGGADYFRLADYEGPGFAVFLPGHEESPAGAGLVFRRCGARDRNQLPERAGPVLFAAFDRIGWRRLGKSDHAGLAVEGGGRLVAAKAFFGKSGRRQAVFVDASLAALVENISDQHGASFGNEAVIAAAGGPLQYSIAAD